MCLPSGGSKDNSAEIARQEEAKRQARIGEGQTAIDNAFSGFNDDFYSGYQDQYLDYYTPQLSDQYSDAVERLTLQLAQTGNLTGSVGAKQLGNLKELYGDQQGLLTNRALDATNTLRGDIDTRKSSLYSENRSAADPGNAALTAASAATALQPTAPTSPLANVFADFFSNLGNTAAIRNAQNYNQGIGVQNYGGGGGNQSVYNVSG